MRGLSTGTTFDLITLPKLSTYHVHTIVTNAPYHGQYICNKFGCWKICPMVRPAYHVRGLPLLLWKLNEFKNMLKPDENVNLNKGHSNVERVCHEIGATIDILQ